MTANDYEVMLTMHMCDNADCVNARFVWLRVPDKLKEDKDLKLAWGFGVYHLLQPYRCLP